MARAPRTAPPELALMIAVQLRRRQPVPPRRARTPPARARRRARNSWLLTSLATVPAPVGPTWNTSPANACSSGSTAATSSAVPPTITLSSPVIAFATPTRHRRVDEADAGAAQRCVQRRARHRASSSTGRRRTAGRGSAASTPSGPVTACSTSAGPGNDRKTHRAPLAAAAADDTGVAPSTPFIANDERSCTRTSYPAATRWPAIGAPIVPSPRTRSRSPRTPWRWTVGRNRPPPRTSRMGRAPQLFGVADDLRPSRRTVRRPHLDRSQGRTASYCGRIGGVRLRPSSSGRRE